MSKDLVKRIRATQADCDDSLAAAALIEQQAAELKSASERLTFVVAINASYVEIIHALRDRIAELESAQSSQQGAVAQRRDDTGRLTSDYEPTEHEVEVCRQAIRREFGNNGTDGYYIRILKAVHGAAPAHPHATDSARKDAMVDDRYFVVPENRSYLIVDRVRSEMRGDEPDYYVLAWTPNKTDAQFVCDAMNSSPEHSSETQSHSRQSPGGTE